MDNLNTIESSCDRLTAIANKARLDLITKNIYQDATGKQYTSTHPNATQAKGGIDDKSNQKGKGTGEYLDTSKGGGSLDVNGRIDVGTSGRNALLTLNRYSKDNPYKCIIE